MKDGCVKGGSKGVVHLIRWRRTEKAREIQTGSTPPKALQIKASGAACREPRGFKFEFCSLFPSAQRTVGLFIAVGVAYFFATWLGVALRPQVALCIYCPAAGVAVGALILFGPNARMPIATSVAITTVASGIMFGKSPWEAAAFGFVNTGQALLTTWLVERWLGDDLKLKAVPQVLGFLVASAIGVALGATGAAIAKTLAEPIAFHYAWQVCFGACLLGTLTIAPLLIGLGELPRELPPRRELFEGTIAIVIFTLLSVLLILLPQEPWDSALPVAFVLPVLLWLAVRCRPVFGAAAASVLAVTIFWSTASHTGYFGGASIPLADRILAAQTYATAGTLLALILSALFAERRSREALLEAGNEQLRTQKETFRRLLGSLPAPIYTTDKAGRITYCNQAAVDLWGTRPELGKDRWSDLWRLRYSDGTPVPLDDRPTQIVLNEGRAVRGREALLERPNGSLVPIMPCPAPQFDEQGRIIGVVNMQIDLTERKQAEAVVKESESRLADGLAAGHVMAFDWNAVTGLTQRSDNATDVLGFNQDELTGSPRNIFLSQVHPDDRTSLKQCIRALRREMPSYALTFRYVRPDGRLVWLEEAGRGEFDATGKLLRVKGLTRDITDRKQAENALAERNAQLALAGQAGRVGSYAYDVNKGVMQISEGYAAIHGLPPGTTETTLCEWRSRVHPDDLRRVEAFRDQVFANSRKESNIEYRIVRSDGEMRWVERRSSVSYDGNARPTRVVGVSIDVTERKRAEERQRILVAELDHRVKNTLATVSSVVSQTGIGNRSTTDFVAALEGRLRSMAATHELLGARCWHGVSMKDLVQRELAPYAARNNCEVSGAEVVLRAEASQAMAMVLHELATNAAKYGALSTKEGRVSIRWDQRLNGRGHPPPLVLEWRESDGPPVIAPSNPGYGTSTIRDLIPYEFGGTVDLAFAPEGIRCRVELPEIWLGNGRELVSDDPNGGASLRPVIR